MSRKKRVPSLRLEERGLTAYEMKYLAMFAMFLDHAAYVFWRPLGSAELLLRVIGRFTFPILAFLLTEGFVHTRNRWVYEIRILLCALISMVPYRLLFGDPYNVLFTLAAGLLILIVEDYAIHRFGRVHPYVWQMVFLGVTAVTAWLMRDFDWGLPGIFAIYVTGQLKHRPYWIQGIGCCSTLLAVTVIKRIFEHRIFDVRYCIFLSGIVLAAGWIAAYNGRRGTEHSPVQKYAFYAFYPLHLLLIWAFTGVLS